MYLGVLGCCYVEATGAVESSRRNPQSCMEIIPIQLMPAILMRDPAYRIDAAISTKLNALEA